MLTRYFCRRALLLLLLFPVLSLYCFEEFGGVSFAAHPPSVSRFIQLTSASAPYGSQYPTISGRGDLVVFDSNADLIAGRNPEQNSEIFLVNVDGTGLTQLTDTTNALNTNASVDARGSKVAFISFSDLVPGENTDNNSEIFLMNGDGTGITELTHSTGGIFVGAGYLANFLPAIDHRGGRIVFVSTIDLIPGQNTDQGQEVFMINTDGSGLVQLTFTPVGDSGDPSFDASGQHIAFISNGNPLGTNPDMNQELFMMNVDGTHLVQLTSTTGLFAKGNEKTSLDANGDTVVFTSEGDLVPGGNLDGNTEIYLLEIRRGQITQITSTVGGRGCFAPSISANGKTVAFSSDRDLVPGSNSDGNSEIFLAELKR